VARPTELVGGPGFQVDNRHHFSVSAITSTRACFIDVQAFEQMLKKSSPFAMEFIKHLNTTTIQLYNKLQTLIQKQMHGRMADTLLYLSKVVYTNDDFETTLSRQDLADMSAMTKESAIRIMKDLKDGGVIDCEANYFRILNEKQLAGISSTG
jgi:CRP/FNR family transcriptional regulator